MTLSVKPYQLKVGDVFRVNADLPWLEVTLKPHLRMDDEVVVHVFVLDNEMDPMDSEEFHFHCDVILQLKNDD